jgi:hypothetical protein
MIRTRLAVGIAAAFALAGTAAAQQPAAPAPAPGWAQGGDRTRWRAPPSPPTPRA